MQLLRLLRILKLMRHYSGWRVLLHALHTAWRAMLVPGFAMLMTILLLSGALWLTEGNVADSEDRFHDGFDAMWCIFWIVTTLGYDGPMGSGGSPGQCLIAIAIVAGLLLTTMPITVIGEAFRQAWEKKEMIEVRALCVHASLSLFFHACAQSGSVCVRACVPLAPCCFRWA